jgi:type II secretory pathway predicted ATPase ExeA
VNNHELLSHFGLTASPFSKEIATESIIELPSFEKALMQIQLLIDTRGIGLLIGKSRVGKSCLLRKIILGLHKGLYKPIYIPHSTVKLTELYTHICTELGLEPTSRRAKMYRTIQERVLTLNKSQKIHPLLVLDEAHLLDNDILQEIRLLTNYEIDSYNALSVILCGLEKLTMRFGLTSLEPLANSITITARLDSLPKEESFSYIEKRLALCGAQRTIFTKNALAFIHQSSGGIMRNINTIANGAMINAYMQKSNQVEAEHVRSVIER